MDNPNPMIGRNASPGETFSLNIGCLNWACAERDNIFSPVTTRLSAIVEYIRGANLDVLVILEANRPSRVAETHEKEASSSSPSYKSPMRSFTSMAAEIEELTGLRLGGVKALNATPNSFGKAFFYRPEKVMITSATQEWTGKVSSFSTPITEAMTSKIVSGSYFGNDVLFLTIHPVVEDLIDFEDGKGPVLRNRVIRDRKLSAAFVHFPPPGPHSAPECISIAEWVRDYPRHVDLWMGDWNTVKDGAGPEIIRIVSERYNHLTRFAEGEGVITFQAFPHDTVKKPADFRDKVVPPSKIVQENEDGTIQVLFASFLDHIFSTKERVYDPKVAIHPITSASDHALVSVLSQI